MMQLQGEHNNLLGFQSFQLHLSLWLSFVVWYLLGF